MSGMRKRKYHATIDESLARLGSQKEGFIYFITPIFTRDVVKIGFSIEPERRRFDIQGGNAELLDVVDCFPAKWNVEKKVHDRFKHLHILREWFHYDEEIRHYIEDLQEAESEGRELRF